MRNFIHSGDLGDVIYSLPAVRALGGGVIHLIDTPGMTAHGMTPERIASIRPLLKAQPYIGGVKDTLSKSDEYVNLNAFRTKGYDLHHTNLADLYLLENKLPLCFRDTPWLYAPLTYACCTVISRSARYHNPDFPWKRVMEKYGRDALFVGTIAEHAAFVVEFGEIPHFPTPTLLAVASLIYGAERFIGNQSAPLAIAHGLGKDVIIEACPYCPNCVFNRPGERLTIE